MKSNLLDLTLFLYNSTYVYLIFILIFDQRDFFSILQIHRLASHVYVRVCICYQHVLWILLQFLQSDNEL